MNEKSYRILVTDPLDEAGISLLADADDAAYELRYDLEKEDLLETIGGYHALIVRSGTQVSRDVIEAGNDLRVIGRAGIGVDNIDLQAATQRGILVMNAPDANALSTAEHTWALILASCRHIVPAHESLHTGNWQRSSFKGIQLQGKKLGIIGFGRIGSLVAARAHGFGVLVQAFDPYVSPAVFAEAGVRQLSLDKLVASSDLISIHASLTSETERMLDANTFGKMKTGVIIINTARGRIIDEAALAEALKIGKVKAAALDVYSYEPPRNSPLIGLPNIIHTPHLAASTTEAQRDVALQIVDQVLEALRGRAYHNVVNKGALQQYDLHAG